MHKVIYQLQVEDIQNVAQQELGRNLSVQEITVLRDLIENRIPWYDVIADSIDEMIIKSESKN